MSTQDQKNQNKKNGLTSKTSDPKSTIKKDDKSIGKGNQVGTNEGH